MKIFDCFMYHNEDTILDVRLNYLDKFVDNFIIVESTYNHRGERKKLNFDIKNFSNFSKKINYLVLDSQSREIEEINDNDTKDEKGRKYVLNGYRRDNFQRNYISTGLNNAELEDIIIISDIDEIPNLNKINLKNSKKKLTLFNQKMCYYKFNLYQENYNWVGSRACKKKKLINPQWLRDVKPKKYPLWRLDNFFSKNKYHNIKFIENGGWHFSNIKTAAEIEYKLKSYLHHREFDLNPMSKEEIEDIIKNKQAIYDLKVDKRLNKIGNGNKLIEQPLNKLPSYIQKNLYKYEGWIN